MKRETRTGNLAITLTCGLILGFAAPFASAQSSSEPNESMQKTPVTQKATERSEKIRADMAKLLAATKAGKVTPRTSQFPQHQSNSLSKGAKIAIVAGIVLVVVAIIAIQSVRNIHCESRCVQ
jgi:hypothetical protein